MSRLEVSTHLIQLIQFKILLNIGFDPKDRLAETESVITDLVDCTKNRSV